MYSLVESAISSRKPVAVSDAPALLHLIRNKVCAGFPSPAEDLGAKRIDLTQLLIIPAPQVTVQAAEPAEKEPALDINALSVAIAAAVAAAIAKIYPSIPEKPEMKDKPETVAPVSKVNFVFDKNGDVVGTDVVREGA